MVPALQHVQWNGEKTISASYSSENEDVDGEQDSREEGEEDLPDVEEVVNWKETPFTIVMTTQGMYI